jgi:hypothetical protein
MRSQTAAIAERVKAVRIEVFGEDGVAALADALGLPAATWVQYEAGVTIPTGIVLGFMEITGACPHWLLTGEGRRHLGHRPSRPPNARPKRREEPA